MKNKIKIIVFGGNPECFFKAMWRQTRGNRDACFAIIREYMGRYNYSVTDEDIDYALADFNGGCEIEWLS
jgi:hypothetical protein